MLVIHHHDAVAAGYIKQFDALMPVVVKHAGGIHAIKRNGLPIERNTFQQLRFAHFASRTTDLNFYAIICNLSSARPTKSSKNEMAV
ncbi:TPA: hypothetical protein ACIIUJ_004121 [Klebsiella aerogenes]